MSLGPLVPRSDAPRNDGLHELHPTGAAEFLRPIGSALYNVLPAQEATLREYLRVLIKRKFLVMRGCNRHLYDGCDCESASDSRLRRRWPHRCQ